MQNKMVLSFNYRQTMYESHYKNRNCITLHYTTLHYTSFLTSTVASHQLATNTYSYHICDLHACFLSTNTQIKIQSCFHVNAISLNYHKVIYICNYPHGSNPAVAILCQEKNGDEYNQDLEMEIHSVIKTRANQACKHA